jgi:hypothetical protein
VRRVDSCEIFSALLDPISKVSRLSDCRRRVDQHRVALAMRVEEIGDHIRVVSPGGRSSETVATAGVTNTFQLSGELLAGLLTLGASKGSRRRIGATACARPHQTLPEPHRRVRKGLSMVNSLSVCPENP